MEDISPTLPSLARSISYSNDVAANLPENVQQLMGRVFDETNLGYEESLPLVARLDQLIET
jgi:hypothetical protein